MDKKLVKVVWHDAADDERTWVRDSEVDEFAGENVEFVSLGFLIRQTAKYVTIAADYSTEGASELTWGRVTKIPMGMVVSIDELGGE